MVLKLGLYKHYKGNLYQVLGLCRHSETFAEMVVYRKLYDDYSLWVRPLDLFTSKVIDDGVEVDRFQFIKELDTVLPILR